MKRLLTTLTLFALVIGLHAQSGIDFFHGSLAEAQEKARTEGKLIFLDAYAQWCGPCKWMARTTFKDAEAGKFFNTHFINMKMDMEAGEGPRVARKIGVRAYPTLAFIDADGNIVKKAEGALDARGLIQLGQDVLDSRPETHAQLDVPGEDEFDEDIPEGAIAPLPNTPPAPGETPAPGAALRADEFETQLMQSIEAGEQATFKQLSAQLLASEVKYKYFLYLDAQRAWAIARDDQRTFTENAAILVGEQGHDAELINNAAWFFYELVDDRALLEMALSWAERSIDIDPNYYNHDTFAMLQYKLGNKDEAIRYAEKAIEIGRARDLDYTSTVEALREMRQ